MGDYFDDDDLINDYMEEDIEPPQEYDDEFWEAELGAVKNDNATKHQPEPMEEDALEETDMQQDTSGEEEIPVPMTVTIKPPEKKPDVYSFER